MMEQNLIQYMIYSKIFDNNTSPYIYFFMMVLYILNQNKLYIISLCQYNNRDESSIIIPYHKKKFLNGQTTIIKPMYSNRFLALNYYIKTQISQSNDTNYNSMVEVINFENTRWFDETKAEYFLLPNNNQRILICKSPIIYFEIISEQDDQEDDKNNKLVSKQSKNYIFKIITDGKLNVLIDFLDACEKKYENEITKIKTQMIYQYIKSYKDEDGKVTMSFESSPFNSNKTFDNMFFENKQVVLEDIRKFSKYLCPSKKAEIEAEYKRIGMPFKQTYLLYGEPGTGKSSLIKAFANETGRHCVLVQWSRIKTSSDFYKLCNQIKIDSNVLSQSEYILVFEDFDANNDSTIKIRDNLKNPELQDLLNKVIDNNKELLNDNLSKDRSEWKIEKEDELTLDAVLNALDGINELRDAVIVFTTNDIKSIDPALIRPGRIDRKIEMKMADGQIIKEMLANYYNKTGFEIDAKITPAELQYLCISNPTIEDCIRELNKHA